MGLEALAIHAERIGFSDTAAYLRHHYVDAQRSAAEIAEEAGVGSETARKALQRAGIPRRHHGYTRVVAARARTAQAQRERRAALVPPAPFPDWAAYLRARRGETGRFRMRLIREETGLPEGTIRRLAHEHLAVPLGPMFVWRSRAEMRARQAVLGAAERSDDRRTEAV